MGLFPQERGLRSAEITLARSVFKDRLPYSWIRIKDDLGMSDRAWTEPGIIGHFILHMGPKGFTDCTTSEAIKKEGQPTRKVFIHELTHAWQGFNGMNYVLDSLWNQCCAAFTGANPYTYTPGSAWSSYNCEQQGSIVADWFALGMSTSSSRFQYIRDNIRKGRQGE
jgi:hypothetical protein